MATVFMTSSTNRTMQLFRLNLCVDYNKTIMIMYIYHSQLLGLNSINLSSIISFVCYQGMSDVDDLPHERRIFLCRINVSRNARRQMRFGDQKVIRAIFNIR